MLPPIELLQEQLDKAQEAKKLLVTRLTKLAEVFARANSVLAGRMISVRVVEQAHKSPAWSSSSEMWLNANEIKFDLTPQSILSLQGISFHELGHLLYTPRNGHELPTWIREQDNARELWEAFNCLEDMRIETLLTGFLPSVSSWLTATIADYLLQNDEAIATAFPLVYGRKYLPTEMRQLAVDNYKSPDDVQALAEIIDEYRLLIFASKDDTEQAKNLIVAFNELLKNLPPYPQGEGEGDGGGDVYVHERVKNPNGHGHRPVEGVDSSTLRPAKPSDQKRHQDNATGNEKPDVTMPKQKPQNGTPAPESDTPTDNAGDTPSNSEGEGNGTPHNGNGTPTNQKDVYGTSFDSDVFDDVDEDFDLDDIEDFNGEMSDEVDDSTTTHQSGSRSAGNAKGITGTNDQVTNVLNDVLNDVLKELSKDINQIAKHAGIDLTLDGGNAQTPPKANFNTVVPPAELVLVAKAFGKELQRLRADHDPAWLKNTDNGKINVLRYEQGADLDTCFDEWSEGRDDVTSIEAVILLDRSSSMSGYNANNAYQSMWAIRKGLEAVEANATVVLFDSYTTVLYDRAEKTGNFIKDAGATGGTEPQNAIMYAKRVLAESDKKIKMLFMITDGAWNSVAGESAITEMKNAGVLTCQAFLQNSEVNAEYLNRNRHSFELVTHIRSAKEITKLGKELVRLAIARNLVRK